MAKHSVQTKMKEAPLAFIDLETTGLDISKAEIIEIGLVLVHQPDLEVMEEWEVKVKPERIEEADPESLEINGYDAEVWAQEAIPLREALEMFIEKTRGAVMVAHNVIMDAGFLENAMEREGLVDAMDYHRLDSMSLAFGMLYHNPEVEKFSLRALAEYCGVKNERAHTALSDARTTYLFVRHLLGLKS